MDRHGAATLAIGPARARAPDRAGAAWLATRAAQVARSRHDRIAPLRLVWHSARLAPGNWLGVLRLAAPLGSLRLAAGERRRRSMAVRSD
jgi:hypothetical protein